MDVKNYSSWNKNSHTNKTLNFIHSSKVLEYEGKYYKQMPNTWNEFPNYFDVNVFTHVDRVETVDENIYQKISDQIEIHHLFEHPSPSKKHVLANWSHYQSALDAHCDPEEDLFFLWYPGRGMSMVFAYMLRHRNLVIWVNNSYRAQFDLERSRLSGLAKRAASTVVFPIYNAFTRRVFSSNLVFYTGEVTFDRDNHINQVAITSCSTFNRNADRINREYTNKLIYIGSQSYRKRLSDALEFVERTDRDVKLTIIGINDGSLAKRENVNVAGKVYDNERFYDILSKHDILLFPSVREQQGKVQLEAMSAGVVPVCADSGGKHTTVKNYYNGLLYEPESVDDLSRCVNLLYENKKLYLDLLENGLEYVETLSVESQVETMASIIQNYYSYHEEV